MRMASRAIGYTCSLTPRRFECFDPRLATPSPPRSSSRLFASTAPIAATVLLAVLVALTSSTTVTGCAVASSTCSINSDCGRGRYCVAGNCRFDCRTDFDCTTGRCELALGKCVTSDGGPVLPQPDLAGTPPPPPDLSTPPPDPKPDLSMPPPQTLEYGDLCSLDADCTSTHCAKHPFTGERECTGPCQSDANCMIGDVCIAQGLNQCAQSDLGNNCQQAADCRMGACLGGGQAGPPICTRLCNSAAQCPAGWACSSVGGSRVCVDVDDTPACQVSAQCWYGTSCDGTRCLGSCRGDLDCPLWHQCKSGFCFPQQAQGRGGIGSQCGGGNDCRGGFCAGGMCVGGCGVTLDKGQFCPGSWGCNPLDAGGGKWTLGCLPGGNGALGDKCNDNLDCGSALCVGGPPGVCSRFCNAAPCPSLLPKCVAVGIVADGVNLKVCSL